MEDNATPTHETPVLTPVPPALPPPPIIRAQAAGAPRARRSIGWMITAIVLFCLLALSVFTQMGRFMKDLVPGAAGMHRTVGPRLEEAVLESAETRNKIAVLTVNGVIMSEGVDGGPVNLVDLVQKQLERAADDDHVKAVVLRVDSPGGEVLASDEIYRMILKFQKDTRKPVVASMGSMAASGGYYVSAPCQWIVANEMTITGSIGVIMSTFNYRGLMDKVGLKPVVFKSGPFKDMLRGSKAEGETTAEERQMIQNLIDETYQRFKSVVQEGRAFAAEKNKEQHESHPLASNWTNYVDGRILSGREAQERGFVDELGNFKTAVSRAKKLAGIQEASLVEYQPIFDLSNLLRLFGKSDAKSLKVDLGLDLPKLKTGCLYFISPTYLH